MENPILHAPQIRLLLLNILPLTPQSFTVKLYVNGLALEDEFAMNNAANIEKHGEHSLRLAAAHSRLLQSWR
jgi:hypothetical protein